MFGIKLGCIGSGGSSLNDIKNLKKLKISCSRTYSKTTLAVTINYQYRYIILNIVMYNDGRDVFSTTPGPFIIVDNDDMNFWRNRKSNPPFSFRKTLPPAESKSHLLVICSIVRTSRVGRGKRITVRFYIRQYRNTPRGDTRKPVSRYCILALA